MKSNCIRRFVLAVGLLFWGMGGNVYAAFIDHGTYIEDTASGLDWLKLTETTASSYNQIITATQSGSLIGWDYATKNQLSAVLHNMLGVGYPYATSSNHTFMEPFVDAFGSTSDQYHLYMYQKTELQYQQDENDHDVWYYFYRTLGIYEDPLGVPAVAAMGGYEYDDYFYDPRTGSIRGPNYSSYAYAGDVTDYLGSGPFSADIAYGDMGSFLVRAHESAPSPVPAPPAFILMLTGLGLLGLTKRFRKADKEA